MKMFTAIGVAFLGVILSSGAALADETTAPKKKVVVVAPVKVVGHRRPHLSIHVARQQPKIELSPLRHPLADRIAQPLSHEPF